MEFIKDYVIDCDNLQVNEVQIILNDCVNHTSETDSSELSKATASNLNVSKITDNLYLCSALSAHISTLQLLGITCVVNSAIELPDTPLPEKTTLYYKINIHDSTYESIKEHFDSTSDLIYKIDASGGKILVHCTAGVSRSATLCIAYLMKHHRLSLLDAYNYVKLQRPIIRPNCGFFRQLVEYERILFGYNTVTMVHNKMLNLEIPDVYNSDYREVDCFRKKGKNRMAIEDIFSDDIKKVNSCIGKFIKVSLMEQRQESGHIYVIDPISETLVLVVQEAEKSKFVVVPRHVILDVQETSEPDRSDLLIIDKPKDLGNVEELKHRRDLLQAWFRKQMIFFEVEGLNLTLGPHVTIEPPYADENILVNTTVAMENIKRIIDQMPSDFQA